MAAFRLPKSCIAEIDRLCAAFLWSGPELNHKKAKVSWKIMCIPKDEGGLGLKSLELVNNVCVLKLIWRILAVKNSLWVDWVKRHLIRTNSFWALKKNVNSGSWIWKKLLKFRDVAKQFYKVEVRNRYSISFWHDKWSSLGCLFDVFGQRGFIDMGVSEHTNLGEVMDRNRRPRHRNPLLNRVEEEIRELKERRVVNESDIVTWRKANDIFLARFSSKHVRKNLRGTQNIWEPHKGIWFQFATLKFAFITWLAAKKRLSTGDRMKLWKQNDDFGCTLCDEPQETCYHLFFECEYGREIWKALARSLMGLEYSYNFEEIVTYISKDAKITSSIFILRYVFQTLIHANWTERNRRRHGEKPIPNGALTKMIDITVIKNSNGSNLAVDIWSLGCTVLEMAIMKPPWSQYEGVPAMFKIGNSKELPDILDHLSEEGKDFVRKCLQRNPVNRRTASQLLEHAFVRNAKTYCCMWRECKYLECTFKYHAITGYWTRKESSMLRLGRF